MKKFNHKATLLPVCPHCGFIKVLSPEEWNDVEGGAERYKCKKCKKRFSSITATVLKFYTYKEMK